MPIFLNIVDEHGQPTRAPLDDLLVEAIIPHIGFIKTSRGIEAAIRAGLDELIRTKEVVVLPEHSRVCSRCKKPVTIWHTYANGSILCHPCSIKPHE